MNGGGNEHSRRISAMIIYRPKKRNAPDVLPVPLISFHFFSSFYTIDPRDVNLPATFLIFHRDGVGIM